MAVLWTACSILFIVTLSYLLLFVYGLQLKPQNQVTKPKFSPWSLPKLQRAELRNVKLLFLLSLITVETSTEVFVRLPQQVLYGSTPSPITSRRKEDSSVVLIFPGANGPDIHTEELKNKIIASDKQHHVHRLVQVYDWLSWRGNFLRASFDGQIVGKTVCRDLAEEESQKGNIRHFHAIGISVGAFAADSCVKAYKQASLAPATTRLTFLDPFTSKGIFGYGWGLQNFGKNADVVEDYLNRDDVVPTTNDPLQLAYTYDITNAPEKKAFKPVDGESFHSWPVAYLAQKWMTETNREGELIEPTVLSEPPGQVNVVQ